MRVKVAGAVVAAVSLGGFAVAAASVVREPTPTVAADTGTTDPTTDPTTTPTDPPVTDPSTDPPVVDPVVDPSPDAPATAPCENHGQRVSQVAHDTPPGPGHGLAVSAAAHDHTGECGQDGVAPTTPAPETEVGDDSGDAPSGVHGHGHGGHGGGKH
jgi:hypothetical protein